MKSERLVTGSRLYRGSIGLRREVKSELDFGSCVPVVGSIGLRREVKSERRLDVPRR